MNVIDLDRLENLVTTSDGWQARCPMCATVNEDKRNKNHLGIKHDGTFSCLKYPREKDHLRGIMELVGMNSDGILSSPYSKTIPEPRVEQPQTWSPEVLSALIRDYSYFMGRGISEDTQKFFKMGVATKGYLDKRVVVPIFDKHQKQILGFTGRLHTYTQWHEDNGIGKWKHKGEVKSFIWPYLPEEIVKTKVVSLVESPGCSLYMYEHNIKNNIVLFGVNISSKIMSYLISLNPKKILISTNNELDSENGGVGNKKALRIRAQLLQFFSAETVEIALPPVKDFGSLHLMENERMLLDGWKEKWLN